ncbi:MAG TPA: hypothetical protein VI756_17545 [Blastocatellia bacterium]
MRAAILVIGLMTLAGVPAFWPGSMSPAVGAADNHHDPDSAEYDVYAAVIARRIVNAGVKKIVIAKNTVKPGTFDRQIEESRETFMNNVSADLSRETVEDYIDKGRGSRQIELRSMPGVEFVLLDQSIIATFFQRGPDGWTDLKAKYPGIGGIFTFSRVGFNHEMNQALVYAGWSCGPLCGHGDFFFLEKHAGAWTIKKQYSLWIS